MFRRRRLEIAERRIEECAQSGGETLDLSGLRLGEVPASVRQLRGLTSLDLSDNELSKLPEWMAGFTQLQSLDLSDNQLWELPEWVAGFTQLQSLDLSYNDLPMLPEWMAGLTQLQSLELNCSQLLALPEWMVKLTQLRNLDLSDNELPRLPEWMAGFTQLQKLDLSDNRLSTLPEWMAGFTQLQSLDLNRNGLSTLPEWMSGFTQLQNLYLRGNGLSMLPEWMAQLTQIQGLYLSGNRLSTLPEWMAGFTQLQGLDLSGNKISTLPEWMARFTQIQGLYLSDNGLSTLPEWMAGFTQLQSLDLNRNRISTLPEWMAGFTQLQSLDLNRNGISTLPEWMSGFTQLQNLYLRGNGLSTLPEWMSGFTQLQNLYLSNNGLSTLPEWMARFTQLQSLDLSDNQLSKVPEWITEFPRLQSLRLSNNKGLTEIDSISILPLTYLSLHNCLKLPAYTTILNSTSDPDTLLTALYSQNTASLNEVRIVLVGEGMVGKTTMRNWMVHGKSEKTDQTDKIDIVEWDLYLDDRKIKARVWDFGGQRIYQSTHQFFLSDRSIYLLVLASRMPYESNCVDKWLRTIRIYGPESPIVVVTNRYPAEIDIPEKRLTREFGPNIRFVEVDGDRGRDVEQLCATIRESVRQLENVTKPIPKLWVDLKDKVADDKRPYLSERDYESLCEGLVDTSDARQTMRRTLDHLGVALEYRARQGILILNPNWIIQGVYSLINIPTGETRNGVITWKDALKRLPPKEYKPGDLEFLVGFMEDCGLCVRIPDSVTKSFLIPDLARTEQENEEVWPEVTEIVYRYDQLLEGILPRLIVDLFPHIQPDNYWKTGCVAVFRERPTRFDLRIDQHELTVTVKGTDRSAREALAVAQEAIEKLNKLDPYRNVAVTKHVPIKGHPGKTVGYQELLMAEEDGTKILPADGVRVDVQAHLGGIRPIPQATMDKQNINTFNGPTQVIFGDNGQQTQNNGMSVVEVRELLAELRHLDGGTESPETGALAKALEAPNPDTKAIVAAATEIAKKDGPAREAVKKFCVGLSKPLAEKSGELTAQGAIWVATHAAPIVEGLRFLFTGHP